MSNNFIPRDSSRSGDNVELDMLQIIQQEAEKKRDACRITKTRIQTHSY
jgi:hypothetical protein